ncbi:MAG: O-antigen ligase family protein [Candidatus Viridilinea halotolerans]|uniref:O-antigen ligase family protein n=1 Tax=Candidatus Viridilinea halotolerans TaxID=2491704 RepID=A0A426U1E9_9CHLR|nr:MAG: O-antigen ligase family protein [Candidatus Viridilinea halotolerans]
MAPQLPILRLLSSSLLALALVLTLALLPLEWLLLLLFGALAVGLALLDPIWAVYLAVLSVPAQELVMLPGGLSLTQASLLLMLASLALHVLAFPTRPLRFGPLWGPLVCFLLTLALSASLTPYSRSEALRELMRWTTVAVIYLATLRALPGAAWRAWGLVACLLLAPSATALIGLGQFWWGVGPESFGVGTGQVRAYGTLGQPNSFAGYMNQAWPLALGLGVALLFFVVPLWRRSRQNGTKDGVWGAAPTAGFRAAVLNVMRMGAASHAPPEGGRMRGNQVPAHTLHGWQVVALLLAVTTAMLLTTAALVVSFSRGGWLGALGGLTLLLLAVGFGLPAPLRRLGQRGLGAGLGLLLMVVFLGGGGLLPQAFSQRAATVAGSLRLFDAHNVVITPANFAVVERMAHLQAAWNMVQRHPWVGVGPGNYSVAYAALPEAGSAYFRVHPWHASRGHAHNYYLHITAEAGLIGLSAYLLLLAAVTYQAVRAVALAQAWFWRGVATGGLGVIAAVATHNLFENLHVLNMGLQLGAIWALLVFCCLYPVKGGSDELPHPPHKR